MTGAYKSLRGREFGYDGSNVFLNGRPIGQPFYAVGGRTIFVDSAAAGSDGFSPATALATLDSAFAKTVANKGDVIVVMPNHAETITGASGITHDVAGVSVIGLGHGNQRPRFLMDAGTSVSYVISAADAYVENLVFASGHSGVVTCFDITAGGAWLNNLTFVNNTTNENFVTPIKFTSTTDGNADLLKVTNCRWFTVDTDDREMIEINANVTGAVITGNYMRTTSATTAPLILVAAGKLLLEAEITDNTCLNLMTSGELFISNDGTTNTGLVARNFSGHADVTSSHDPGWTSGGWRLFNNLSTSVDTLQGVVVPAADANS